VKHVVYPVADSQKFDLLLALLNKVNYDSAIIFCRTKHRADRVAHQLKRNNHAVAVLHSNRTQREREQALRGFRDGRFEVLVATDIAARGLDINEISYVINYDMPDTVEAYTHRIGRTGRAERTGEAFTFTTQADELLVRGIEKALGARIERRTLPGFDYAAPAAARPLAPSPARPAPAPNLSFSFGAAAGAPRGERQQRRRRRFLQG